MSVRGRIPARAFAAQCLAILPVLFALALAGCSDGIFSPNRTGSARLQLQPVFSTVDWQSLSVNINLIRVTATQLPARSLVLRQETSVDPNAPEWQVPLDLPVGCECEVLVELINRTGTTDVVVYSGRALISVKAGTQPSVALIPVFPGPPANLDITSLTVEPSNQGMLEGEQLQLTATVVGTSSPTIIWSSSNPNVVTVDDNGVLQAAGLGQATIHAVAGPKSDDVTIDVGARAAAMELTPTAVTLLSLNDEVAFNGRVLDARNAQIDLPVTYQISDPSVALHTGNGRFRALRSGSATITASALQKGQTVSASTTLTVQQTAVTLTVNPSSKGFSALGEKHTVTADARDAMGNAIPGGGLTWSSADITVATVDGNGVVTAVGNGTTSIKVASGALSTDVQVTVEQVEASITMAPNHLSLNVGEAFQLTSAVYDSRGNQMNVPITWTIIGHLEIATVSSTGLVTAGQQGSVTVNARFNNLQAVASLTVRVPITQVVFDRPQLNLVLGAAQQIAAFLADEDSTFLGGVITYATQDPGIATVNSNGVVSAVSAGQTFIIASGQGFQARLPVTVISPVTQIVFDRPALQLAEGQTQQITAYLADALGSPGPGDPIVFTTTNPGIASINAAGVVSAVSSGTTEIVAQSQGLERRLSVTVVVPPPGDMVVFPDLNVFDESPDAPSNRRMLENLVTFSSNAVRSTGNEVWLNQPDASNCAFCNKTFDFMRSEIRKTGLKAESISAGTGRLTNIPNSVKALFLFVQNTSFTTSEVALLQAFIATGGRLVLLGGHEASAAKQPSLNNLLASLGSSLRLGTESLGCGRDVLPASSLRAHQITAGMTDFRPGCNVELLLGGGDTGLVYDATNTIPIVAVTTTGGGQN